MNDQVPTPSEADVRAYLQGTLTSDRFAEVDAWVAQPAAQAEVERLLAAAEPLAKSIPALERTQPSAHVFAVDAPRGRLIPGATLGEGGMGIVRAAHDRALQRTVALKILRSRQPSEFDFQPSDLATSTGYCHASASSVRMITDARSATIATNCGRSR